MRYLVQVFVRAFLLVAGYCGAIAVLPSFQNHHFATSWWQQNRVKLQFALSDAAAPATAVAGSSLSAELPSAAFPGGLLNLALVGGSPLTGLECLLRSDRAPARVLIETNWLDRGFDSAFDSWEYRGPATALRNRVAGLRAEDQPANVAANAVHRLGLALGATPTVLPDATIREARIARDEIEYQSAVDAAAIRRNIDLAAQLVSRLQARGCRVMLYEAPVDPRLAATWKYRLIRALVRRRFQGMGVIQLPPFPGNFRTIDGNHLDGEDLARFAAFLGAQAQDAFPVLSEGSPDPKKPERE